MARLGRSRPARAYLFIGRPAQPSGSTHTASAGLTVTPTFSAAAQHIATVGAALTVTPTFTAAAGKTQFRTAALTVTPTFSATGSKGSAHTATAALTVTPAFTAAAKHIALTAAGLTVTPTFAANASLQGTAPPMSVVAATYGGGQANGILLRVLVLDNTAANPLIGWQPLNATGQNGTVTSKQTGSEIYGVVLSQAAGTFTFETACTGIDNVDDTTNGAAYGTFSAGPTGTPGAVTVGATAGTGGSVCAVEFLPAGTISLDASSPAVALNTAGNSAATAEFTPPAGALIVALVAARSGSINNLFGAVSDTTGLQWNQLIAVGGSGNDGYTGIWYAYAPPINPVTPPAPSVPFFPAGYEPQQSDFDGWWYDTAWFHQKKVVFRARQTVSPTSLPSSGANTTIAFDTVDEDPTQGWTGSPTYAWTPKISGWYQVTVTLQTVALPGGGNADSISPILGGTWDFSLGDLVGSTTHATGVEGQFTVYLIGGSSTVQGVGALKNASSAVNTSTAAGSQSSIEIVWLST